MDFKIHSNYKPTGDQPQTIDKLVQSIQSGNREQTMLGVTGSGKTFTMANIIERVQRPTLVLAHNKTLAAQLCSEFKEFLKARRNYSRVCFMHIQPGQPDRLPKHGNITAPGHGKIARRACKKAC